MKTALLVIVLLVLLAGAWVRLAPVDPAKWNRPPAQVKFSPEGGYLATVTLKASPEDVLKALDEIARATPRTRAIAGTPQDGLMTWQTRSALWGFPDYTTAEAVADGAGTRLTVVGRLRFGRGDFGVNRARVTAWLQALQQALG